MPDVFISVDIETAGPAPSTHALLSLGACVVDDPERAFYAELQPASPAVVPEALEVSGLSMAHLAAHGLPAEEGMRRFAAWVAEVCPPGARPVFVAFNAGFDWMFVADYFSRFGVANPFGHSALDLKSLYMGVTGEPWERTSFFRVANRLGLHRHLSHHALEDARAQATVFRRLLAGEIPRRPAPPEEVQT